MVTLRSCFPMLPHCLPAGNSGQQQIPDGSSPLRPNQQQLPDGASLQCPCQQQLCHGAHASSIFPMALRHGAPGQQQTSSGGEEYSGLASNLAHLGRIC